MTVIKVVQNFRKQVTIFHFDKISKMRIQELKNAPFEGSKKAQGRRIIKSKDDRN